MTRKGPDCSHGCNHLGRTDLNRRVLRRTNLRNGAGRNVGAPPFAGLRYEHSENRRFDLVHDSVDWVGPHRSGLESPAGHLFRAL
jgi:hypothetical protein